jgi:hypothetical protein
MPSSLKPYALLLLLGLIFFVELVLHPTQVLYSDYSDILAMHLPDKMFLVRSLHETGELPLWCPYRFAGVPFIHDFQVGAYYPPHWLLMVLGVESVGAGLSWLVVLHVVIAGWTMHAYARFRGLTGAASIVAALGWMFSGKLLLHVLVGGHFNMLMLAWLPLSIWLFESALGRAGAGQIWPALARATWAGAVFALLVLTAYPYVTLYAGLLLAAWSLGPVLEQAGYLGADGPRTWQRTCRALARWFVLGAWAAGIAVAVGAVQLLPGLEAARYATRGGAWTNPFSETVWPLVFVTGPSLLKEPASLMWEVRGGFGVVWLAVAVLAPVLQRGRTRFEAGVGVFFFLLALGGIVLFYWIPGVGIFRLPSRIFLVAAFPVAFLAGTTTQILWCSAKADPNRFTVSRRVFLKTVSRLLLLSALALVMAWRGDNLRLHPYWLALAASIPLITWILSRQPASLPPAAVWLWCACLLLDLWALVWPEVHVRGLDEIYPVSPSVASLAENARHERVLDFDREAEVSEPDRRPPFFSLPVPAGQSSVPTCSPLGYGAPMAMDLGIESLRGFNPVDVKRYKEYLQFMTDEDEPIRPLDDRCTFGFPVIGNFNLVNTKLADLMGVRYFLLPGRPADGMQADWHAVLVDSKPRALTIAEGGVPSLGPYTLYRSESALPRAFVVPEAAPLPERTAVLAALKQTDFHQRVLLEGCPDSGRKPVGSFRPAIVRKYEPNHVVIDVPDGEAGYLVLADIWYPGWNCRVDGKPQQCFRADYLFRAVQLEQGPHEVEFRFEPVWYARGRIVSFVGLLLVCGVSVVSLGRWIQAIRSAKSAPLATG